MNQGVLSLFVLPVAALAQIDQQRTKRVFQLSEDSVRARRRASYGRSPCAVR
jgi:hypothetical protein